jgi:Predicted membrane protein (DUF2207)
MGSADFYFIPVALAAYYLLARLRSSGRSGHESIVVQYQPPSGLSPAAARYIFTMGVDGRTYASILVQLATRKLLSIMPASEGVSLNRLHHSREAVKQLTDEERMVLKELFEWQDTVQLAKPSLRLMEKNRETLQARLYSPM